MPYLAALALSLLLSLALDRALAQPLWSDQPGQHLTFGFLPIVSSERLVRRFAPLVNYLSGELGMEIRMETATGFAEFIRRTDTEQRYDLLFTAPHLYALAQRRQGYRALARVDEAGMKAVIVVPADSPIRSLQDLRGRRLATTDPLALATLLVRSTLLQSGVDPDTDLALVATPSHNASLLSTHQGTTDASALILPLFQRSRAEIRDTMRILAQTQSVPHMPIAAAPWLSAELVQRLRTALLGMADTARGRVVLDELGWPGLKAAAPGDYDSLEWVADQAGI